MVAPVGVGPQGISSGDARRSGPGFVIEWAKADLLGAKLVRASLDEANLTEAILISADLSGSHLSGAILIDADLADADLYGADLSGADLTGADLSRAVLTGTNFDGAKHDYHTPKPPTLGNPPPRCTAGKVLKPKGNVGPLAPASPT